MKKIASLVIVLIMVFFVGCSNRSSSSIPAETITTANTGLVSEEESFEEKSSETTSKTTTMTTTTTKKATTTTTKKTTIPKKQEKENEVRKLILPVKNIQQNPELPGGCEITSTTILLNYLGFNADKLDLARNYLPTNQYPDENGCWLTPWDAFIGSPEQGYYGCYAPVIEKTINNYFKKNNISGYEIIDLTGTDFSDLYQEIKNGNPVVIWLSQDMVDIDMNQISWPIEGGTFQWTRYEHCLVMIGYDLDKNTIFFSDPLDPRGTVEYPVERVRDVYSQVYKQALVVKVV